MVFSIRSNKFQTTHFNRLHRLLLARMIFRGEIDGMSKRLINHFLLILIHKEFVIHKWIPNSLWIIFCWIWLTKLFVYHKWATILFYISEYFEEHKERHTELMRQASQIGKQRITLKLPKAFMHFMKKWSSFLPKHSPPNIHLPC